MKIFITRQIPDKGIQMLKDSGFEVIIGKQDRPLAKEELISELEKGGYGAVLCQLTEKIDADVLEAGKKSGVRVFANYAVGFDNIDVKAAEKLGIFITNTPGVLTDSVAEHAIALMLAVAHRIPESDRFTRDGKYKGWSPMLLLGHALSGKTLGIIGLGRIGSRVAHHAVKGFDMKVLYHDVKRNEEFEKEFGAVYKTLENLLRESDFVSVHVPLLPATKHLINAERLRLMKPTAYLVNTSRGPVVDEQALVAALRNKTIQGAALDVFENEPALASGLAELDNVVLTPHTATATEETRQAMSELAAKNIIETLEGRTPSNLVKI